jgi:hypothetical protein
MMRRRNIGIVLGIALAGLIALRYRGSPRVAPNHVVEQAQEAGEHIFDLEAEGGPPGGEARVRLRSLPTSGTIVTVIGELNYDPQRLRLKHCDLNPIIPHRQTSPDRELLDTKSLYVSEPTPGVLRALVAGGIDPLPPTSELFTCTFGVRVDAPEGPVAVRAHGDVSSPTFDDRNFAAAGEVVIGN